MVGMTYSLVAQDDGSGQFEEWFKFHNGDEHLSLLCAVLRVAKTTAARMSI